MDQENLNDPLHDIDSPRTQPRDAVSIGWHATVAAVRTSWLLLFVSVGVIAIAGSFFESNGALIGQTAKNLFAVVIVVPICALCVRISQLAVELVAGQQTGFRTGRNPLDLRIWHRRAARHKIQDSTLNFTLVFVPSLILILRFGFAPRFAACNGLTPMQAFSESWRCTGERVQEVGRVAGSVAMTIAVCLVLLTAILAVVLSQHVHDPSLASLTKWSHSITSALVIVFGVAWMSASVSALIDKTD